MTPKVSRKISKQATMILDCGVIEKGDYLSSMTIPEYQDNQNRNIYRFIINIVVILGIIVVRDYDSVMAQSSSGGMTQVKCCSGNLTQGDPTWNPPTETTDCGLTDRECRRSQDSYYYDAYAVNISESGIWNFNTCGYYNNECQSLNGFSTRLLLYRAPFYPELPCHNLISCDNTVGNCSISTSYLTAQLGAGQYVIVVSSEQNISNMLNQNRTNSYHIQYAIQPSGIAQPVWNGECVGYESPDLATSECTGSLDSESLKLGKIGYRYTSSRECGVIKKEFAYFSARHLTIDYDSFVEFSMCGSAAGLAVAIYRGDWQPATDPCVRLGSGEVRTVRTLSGDCKHQQIKLEEGEYVIVVYNNDGRDIPLNSAKNYHITIKYPEDAAELDCTPLYYAEVDSTLASWKRVTGYADVKVYGLVCEEFPPIVGYPLCVIIPIGKLHTSATTDGGLIDNIFNFTHHLHAGHSELFDVFGLDPDEMWAIQPFCHNPMEVVRTYTQLCTLNSGSGLYDCTGAGQDIPNWIEGFADFGCGISSRCGKYISRATKEYYVITPPLQMLYASYSATSNTCNDKIVKSWGDKQKATVNNVMGVGNWAPLP